MQIILCNPLLPSSHAVLKTGFHKFFSSGLTKQLRDTLEIFQMLEVLQLSVELLYEKYCNVTSINLF